MIDGRRRLLCEVANRREIWAFAPGSWSKFLSHWQRCLAGAEKFRLGGLFLSLRNWFAQLSPWSLSPGADHRNRGRRGLIMQSIPKAEHTKSRSMIKKKYFTRFYVSVHAFG